MTTSLVISCPPRFGTPRRTDRPTLGPAVGRVAEMLGRPFMPWQQHVADVVFELDPSGLLVYREVNLTVPRQSGKTLLELVVSLHRGLATKHFGPRQRMVYTAQKRKAARKKWEEDFVPDLEAARGLRGKFTVRRGYGEEGFRFANGSTWGLEAATETAGHGSVLDLAFIDEAFAQVDGRLEQAFRPAMTTRTQPQRWIVSTMGWLGQMPYLWPKVERGRARCEEGLTEGVAYFEWSAPDDADPDDPATWWATMPALGHTQTEETVRGERETAESPEDFARAYLNQVKPKPLPSAPSVLAGWAECRDLRSRRSGAVSLAVDVTPDRSMACLAAAGPRADGKVHVEVVAHDRGTSWLVARTVKVAKAKGVSTVTLEPGSPAGSLAGDFERAGLVVIPVTAREYGQACGKFYDRTVDGTLAHIGQEPLDLAVEGARKRTLGEAWAWDRRTPTVDISPLVAVTLAAWQAGKPQADVGYFSMSELGGADAA